MALAEAGLWPLQVALPEPEGTGQAWGDSTGSAGWNGAPAREEAGSVVMVPGTRDMLRFW